MKYVVRAATQINHTECEFLILKNQIEISVKQDIWV